MVEIFKVVKVIRGNTKQIVDDPVAEEVPLTLMIGGKELVTLLCMPSDLEDLAAGFLFTSGLIKRAQDIKGIVVDRQRWTAYIDLATPGVAEDLVFKRLFTSGCGMGTLFYNPMDIMNRVKIVSDFKIGASEIISLMLNFQRKSDIYLKTGGVHSAALADKNDILIFKEDIGRHNAVDKVIGCGLRGIGFADKILLSSGRISSEILFKVQKARVPVLISQAAPTDQAVRLARDMDITLIGFARGRRLNIYSKEERVACVETIVEGSAGG